MSIEIPIFHIGAHAMPILTPYDFATKYTEMPTYLYTPELTTTEEEKGGFDCPTNWQRFRVAHYRLGESHPEEERLWRSISAHWNKLTKPIDVTVRTLWGVTDVALLTPLQLRQYCHQASVFREHTPAARYFRSCEESRPIKWTCESPG